MRYTAAAFSHGGVGEHSIAERGIGQLPHHRGLDHRQCPGARHCLQGQFRHAVWAARRHRFVFIEADSRYFRMVSLDKAEVVLRDVRELRAACALAQSPDAGRRRFEAFVHQNVSTRVQGHAGFVQPDVPRIGNSASCDKDIAARADRTPFRRRGI
jgi:hypothetical protein